MADPISEQQLAQLVAELAQLPPRKVYAPSLLEVAGFPSWENVWSNILAFYFQSTNGHGLGNTVFRAFMAMLGEEVASETEVKASREQTTTNRGRIDLVLETEDVVVGIENKVYQVLDNPLDDYRDYLIKRAAGRRVVSSVLSLNSIKPEQQLAPDWCFVTYREFCAKLRQYIDLSAPQLGNKYVMFLNDFIASIEQPNQGTIMDSKRLDFFKQHRADTETLLKEVAALKQDMRRKVEALDKALSETPPPHHALIQHGLVPSTYALHELLWIRVSVVPGLMLVLDVVIAPTGWELLLHNERVDQTKVDQWLKDRAIRYHTRQDPWRAVIDDAPLGYDADIEHVYEWVMEYLAKVLPSA